MVRREVVRGFGVCGKCSGERERRREREREMRQREYVCVYVGRGSVWYTQRDSRRQDPEYRERRRRREEKEFRCRPTAVAAAAA